MKKINHNTQSIDVYLKFSNKLSKIFKSTYEILELNATNSSSPKISVITDNILKSENFKNLKLTLLTTEDLKNIKNIKDFKQNIKTQIITIDSNIYNSDFFNKFFLNSKQFKKILKRYIILINVNNKTLDDLNNGKRYIKIFKTGLLYSSFSSTSRQEIEIKNDLDIFLKNIKDNFYQKFSRFLKIKKCFISSTFGKSTRII